MYGLSMLCLLESSSQCFQLECVVGVNRFAQFKKKVSRFIVK